MTQPAINLNLLSRNLMEITSHPKFFKPNINYLIKQMTKRMIIIFCLPILLSSCGGNASNQETSNDTSIVNNPAGTKSADSSGAKSSTISIATSTDKGADLIVKNDCRNCHREREKLIGPAFSDIAKRYGAIDVDALATKVIKGGSGHWGDAAMSSHPSLSVSDAKTIVEFILQYK
jgi:cytochrome c